MTDVLNKPRVRQVRHLRNGTYTYSDEYEAVPTLFDVINRVQQIIKDRGDSELAELVQYWREYTLLDEPMRERLLHADISDLKLECKALRDEIAKLRRESTPGNSAAPMP